MPIQPSKQITLTETQYVSNIIPHSTLFLEAFMKTVVETKVQRLLTAERRVLRSLRYYQGNGGKSPLFLFP